MKHFLGEFIGTFILVFLGCGSVGISLIYKEFTLPHIALCWSLAVTLGVFASRNLSHAHLNPAVSVAMVFSKKITIKQIPSYLTGQFLGSFFAAFALFILFKNKLSAIETTNAISRESENAYVTAKMFGEYYNSFSTTTAFVAEAAGTATLVLMIYILTSEKLSHKYLTPIFIGLVVGGIIMLVAPITQAGLNPARDLAPRIFSYIAGWKNTAFSAPYFGWITVYVIAPTVGGFAAFILNTVILKKLQA